MGLFEQAAALERRIKLKPQGIEFIINMNPCYECEGCEKCAEYHRLLKEPPDGKIIIVADYGDEEDC